MIPDEQEQTADDFTTMRQPSVNETDSTIVELEPKSYVEQLREQVSVASSQGFQQQTSFGQSGRNRNSLIPRNCGTSSSDNASTKGDKGTEGKSDKDEEMEVDEEEGDSDIIPPSEHGESRVTSFRHSVSQSRDSTQSRTGRKAEDDPFQFTMSQSQRERDDLDKIKKDRKGKRRAAATAEVTYIFINCMHVHETRVYGSQEGHIKHTING